jgi:glucosyl-3-phosphoglycerate synthase
VRRAYSAAMDFQQNRSITTLHNLRIRTLEHKEEELRLFSGYRPMELVLPCLYSEIAGPALGSMVEQLASTSYLGHITIGLDKATKSEFEDAKRFFNRLKVPHSVIWNDGPRLTFLRQLLENAGLEMGEQGKGRNVWTCIGHVISRGKAEVVGFHDCDILTYNRDLLANLFLPLANPDFDFEFCKGYYARVADGKLNGRVVRLLMGPLLASFRATLGANEYLDYMESFRYPLSGEFSVRRSLLRDLRVPFDWGLEVGLLSEVYRNQATNRICQAEICDIYDHKHQPLSAENADGGLSKMSTDIIKSLIRKLAIQGHSFSKETMRSIKASYYRFALDAIDKYKADAAYNALQIDLNSEEKAVELFAENVMRAGETFAYEPMAVPFMPTWSRVSSACPDFLYRLRVAIEEDNGLQSYRAA